MNEYTAEELMSRAMDLLQESYDPDTDSFFVVVTEGGKVETDFNGAQAIVGEINLKTVVAFMVQVVSQLCASMGQHPFVFISRHITSHFVDIERAQVAAMAEANMAEIPEEEDPGVFISRAYMDDVEN